MSAGNLDLGALRWTIDADDSAFNAKLDRAEARARSFGQSINSVIGGGGGYGGPATFGGQIVSGANTVGQIGRNYALPNLPALASPPLARTLPGLNVPAIPDVTRQRAMENELWLAETRAWFAANRTPAGPGDDDADPVSSGRSSTRAFGFIRPLTAGYFAWRGINAMARAQDQNEQMDRILARGSMDEQVQASLSQTRERNRGIVALNRNSFAGRYHPLWALLNYIEGGTPAEQQDIAEDAAQSFAGQQAAQAASVATRRIARATEAVTANPFRQIQLAAQSHLDPIVQKAGELRQQAIRMTGHDAAGASMLTNSANALEAAGRAKYNATVTHESWDLAKGLAQQGIGVIRSVAASTFNASNIYAAQTAAANTAATGNSFDAHMIMMRASFAQDEAEQKNPVIRFMSKMAHGAIIAAAVAGHAQDLKYQTGMVSSATSGLSAQMPDIGIEESSRRERLELEQRRDIELDQYKRANPADAAGYSARADYWKQQVELNDAQKQSAIYRRDITTAGGIRSAQLVISGNPLGATINDIQTQTALNVAAAGGANTPAGQQQQELGKSREALARYERETQETSLNIGIAGQARAYGQLLGNNPNPIGAKSTMAAADALLKAYQLDRAGFQEQGSGVLDNALSEQYLIRQDYLKSFRAVQFDSRDNAFNPRDTEDTGKTLQSIDENIKRIADNLLVEQ
jgi:hypothetical protein